MPHTYMRTTGGGAKVTTARWAVSYSRITGHRSQIEAGEAQPRVRLVPDVHRHEHGGERFEGRRVGERSGVDGAQVGDAVDDVVDGLPGIVVVGRHEHVVVERVVEVEQVRRREMLERGGDVGLGNAGRDLLRTRTERRDDG